jgi:hypothetical protein
MDHGDEFHFSSALRPHIKEYMQNQQISTNDKKVLRNLAAYLTFYNIPSPSLLKG